jgi:hypothetical protein
MADTLIFEAGGNRAKADKTALAAEIARAVGAEAALTSALAAKASTTVLTAETSRATAAEGGLDTRLDALETGLAALVGAELASQIMGLIASEEATYSAVSNDTLITPFLLGLAINMRLAQVDAAIEGVNTSSLVNPAVLKAVLQAWRASADDLIAGTAEDLFATPDGIRSAFGAVFASLTGPMMARPGDNPKAFGEALTGSPPAIASLAEDLVAASTKGNVIRRTGAAITAVRGLVRIEEGRLYRARGVVRRNADPSDPAGDTVRIAVQYLSQSLAAQSQLVLQDLTLETTDGRVVVSGTLAIAPTVADHAVPAGAVYARTFCQTYGLDGQTDVEVLELTDVTDVASALPSTTALEAILNAALAAVEALAIGEPNGIAPLDDDAFLPLAHMQPAAVAKPFLNIFVPSIHDLGTGIGAGDVAIDTAAAQAAAGTGKIHKLKPGGMYDFAERIYFDAGAKVGFVAEGRGGRAIINARTGVGQFGYTSAEKADPGNAFGARGWVFMFSGSARPTLHGVEIWREANVDPKWCQAVLCLDCDDIDLDDIYINGFHQPYLGLTSLDSCRGGRATRIKGENCIYTDGNENAQLTLLAVDANRKSGAPFNGMSQELHIDDIFAYEVMMQGDALQNFSQQADVLNLQGYGHAGHHVGRIYGYRTGEVLDCWSDDNVFEHVSWEDAYMDAIKFLNGGSRNLIKAIRGNGTGLAGVAFYNSPNADGQVVSRNRVYGADIRNVGRLRYTDPLFGGNGARAAYSWFLDGGDAYHLCDNRVEGFASGYDTVGANNAADSAMPAVVAISNGTAGLHLRNSFAGGGAFYSDGFTSMTGPPTVAIRRDADFDLKYKVGAPTIVANEGVLPFDTRVHDLRGDWNTVGHSLVADCHQTLLIDAAIRTDSLQGQRMFGVIVQKNGVALDGETFGLDINDMASTARQGYATASVTVRVAPGDGVRLALLHTDLSGSAAGGINVTTGALSVRAV